MSLGRMRWRTPRSALVVVIVGSVVALQLNQASPEQPVADAVVVSADGDLDLRNSSDGQPVLSAAGLGPGDTAAGQVTVSNAGMGSGQFSVKRQALSDSPGAGGGALSERLQLVVRDVTVSTSPTTVYSGALGAMSERGLGTLGPGEARVYHFAASFPEGGSADNAYEGAAASVAYKWTVSSSSVVPPVDPPVTPPVNPPAGPATPPGGGPGGPSNGGSLPTFVQSRLRLTLKVPKAQKIKRKTLAVRVKCTQSCRISASGRIGVKRVKKPMGKTRVARKSGKPGRWVTIKLKLSKKTLAKMAVAQSRRKTMTLKVTVNATAKGSRAKAAKTGRIR